MTGKGAEEEMKHGKNPTVKQKKWLKEHRMNPDNWLVCKDTQAETVIEHRHTGKHRAIMKG